MPGVFTMFDAYVTPTSTSKESILTLHHIRSFPCNLRKMSMSHLKNTWTTYSHPNHFLCPGYNLSHAPYQHSNCSFHHFLLHDSSLSKPVYTTYPLYLQSDFIILFLCLCCLINHLLLSSLLLSYLPMPPTIF